MTDPSQQLIDMIERRMANRLKALEAIADSPLENLPNGVKTLREIESAKLRAVVEEQSDLIEIIKMLFPSNAGKDRQNRKG